MIALLTALMLPPFVVAEAAPNTPVPYEFAFAAEAGESRAEVQERLREEAMDYCRVVARDAGVPGEAASCARKVVEQVTAQLDDAAYATFASR